MNFSGPRSKGRPLYRLYQCAWNSLDWLFPPLCGGCGAPGMRWCSDCQNKTQIIAPPSCKSCGQTLIPLTINGICVECQSSPPACTEIRSWAHYQEPLRSAIHRLKYKGDISLGEVLARPMVELFFQQEWAVDLIVPVPATNKHQAKRGYNQAQLLARPVALASGISLKSKALQKVRETRSQVELSGRERKTNLTGAFSANPRLVSGRVILLVDDIVTSGSTLNECASALMDAGAKQVFALTLARAGLDTHL